MERRTADVRCSICQMGLTVFIDERAGVPYENIPTRKCSGCGAIIRFDGTKMEAVLGESGGLPREKLKQHSTRHKCPKCQYEWSEYSKSGRCPRCEELEEGDESDV